MGGGARGRCGAAAAVVSRRGCVWACGIPVRSEHPFLPLALKEPGPRSFKDILKPHAEAFHRLLVSSNLKWIRLWSGQEGELTVFLHQKLF